MAEKYSISGRIDSFEFELIDSIKSVNSKPSGYLTGVNGGQLTWDDETDLKLTGQLDVSDSPMLTNKYIRIYYVSKIPIESSGKTVWKTYRYLLGTCYAATSRGHLENRKYSGNISLTGTMSRYLDDEIIRHIGMSKGTKVLQFMKKVFSWYGGQYKISGLKDLATSQPHVWEFGSSPYSVLSGLASFVGGRLTTNRNGETVVQKYTAPSKRPVSYSYPVGTDSVTLLGIDIESTQSAAINRAAVKYVKREQYTQGGKTKTREVPVYGVASLDASNTVSKQKTGKFATYTETLSSLKPETQAKANAIAKSRLSSKGGYTVIYTVKSMFLPVSIGQVVRFRYESLDVDAVILSIDYDLKPGCPMTTRMRRIRKHV